MRRDLRGALLGMPAGIAPRPPRTPFKYLRVIRRDLRGALIGRPAGIAPGAPRTPFKYLRGIWRASAGPC